MAYNIQILATPDQQKKQFKFDFKVSNKTVEYQNSTQAQRSSIATKIFGFPWTEKVEVGPDYVVVQKQDWVDWDILAEPLAGLIREHFEMKSEDGVSEFEENPDLPQQTQISESSDPVVIQVQKVLDSEINPMVASHGGKISLVDVQGDTAFVRLEGGCQGCSSSQATLRQGVEVAIRRSVPSIKSVIDVTDHASGETPFM